ncbi:membrane protein, putative [hydrothermal vent metagenome]|uniref:Membrane protein, putative n=1 Tax=hydrothermal vent metagenome TaxID=652676 RepID=A0A3B0RWR4_9ZZZZ
MTQFKPLILSSLLLLVLTASFFAIAPAVAQPASELCGKDSQLAPALCAALLASEETQIIPPTPQQQFWQTARLYVKLGYIHILPKGTDHILFVLALFFASTRLKPLLLQISVFTVAHTLTLALAATGKINVPASIVEPVIAASIAFVAIENLLFKDMTRWRPVIVFGFGLVHGLGFAGVLAEMGLPQAQFTPALISFNIGVELGQISVIVLAWILLHRLYQQSWYRTRIIMPVSLLIAAIGLFWALQRLLF